MTHPYRSVLYIPGSKERALEKAKTLPVDAIIFDLEDAVAVDEKENARNTLAAALTAGGYGDRAQIVRITALDTEGDQGAADHPCPGGELAIGDPLIADNNAVAIRVTS